MPETFYDVLAVDEDATQERITEAYREMVKEHHPDVSEAEDAGERFRKIVRAEEVLGDPEERERYDSMGHAAYMRRVEGENAAGAEHSPWTTGDRRDRNRDPSPDEDAWTDREGDYTPGGEAEAEGFGTASASAGFGAAANRQSGANATGSGGSDRWSADAYAAGGTGDVGESSFSVHDWDEETAAPNTVTLEFTQELMIVAVAMFFLYPLLVWASVAPSFPMFVNVVVGICTFLAVGYMLTVPKVAIAVFGAWSVAAPVGVLTLTDWGLGPSLFAIAVCWVPLAYALVVAYVTRPG
ncbi:hypothetical protein BRD00_08070 [Halobacteriales archaeon QS_8_69_26]|nr:MAG: hypothetical protein BRD00_08070 [Halobacteriales archaeon QS_8_69_26]